jgi:hypothetical protein
LEEEIGEELSVRLKIDAVPYGKLLSRPRFEVVQPVNKPRVIGEARPDGRPLTLDDLMPP